MYGIIEILNRIKELKDNYSIFTVTLNPVIDKTILVPGFKAGKTLLIEDTKNTAAGKGINISRALQKLYVPSIATGILPQTGADYFNMLLKKDNLSGDFLLTKGILRNNITIVSDRVKRETHLRERGSIHEPDILKRFKEKLIDLVAGTSGGKKSVVIFSGSVPAGMPHNSYRYLIDSVKKSTDLIFLDSSGAPLKEGVKSQPYGIKPNIYEAREILQDGPGAESMAERFYRMGINHVFLSMGEKGIIYFNGNELVKARVKVKNPVNSVGSGDASLAGGIAAILSNLGAEETAALSCAAGAANTTTPGAGNFSAEDLIYLYKRVKLKTISRENRYEKS